MVRFHVWTLAWIIVLLWIFSPIVDADKNKHRIANPHRHRHGKHPKHQPPSVKNSSSEKYPRKLNMTKIINTVSWLPTATSTSQLLFNSRYPNNETITSFANFSTIVQKTININFFDGTHMPSTIDENSSVLNDVSGLVKKINISRTTRMKNVFVNSSIVPTGLIEGTWRRDATASLDDFVYPNYMQLQPTQEETTTIAPGYSRSPDTSRKVDIVCSSAEKRTNVPKILMNSPPIVQLVRKKKRSIRSEQSEATDQRSREPTLLSFNGPSIVSEAEKALDRESSQSFHKRVKRDSPEREVIPSAVFTEESNDFQKLEDPFAFSALEGETRAAQDSGSQWRTSRQSQSSIDSSPRLSRPKIDNQEYKNKSYNTNVYSAELKKIALADYVVGNDNITSVEKIDENYYRRNASSRDLLTGRTERVNAINGDFGLIDSRTTLDLEHPENSSYSLDSSTSPVSAEPKSGDNKTDTIHVDSRSQHSSADNSTVNNDEPITRYRFENTQNEANTSSASSGNAKINDFDGEVNENNLQPDVVSVSIDSGLKDDNSILRYGLDDVYPEMVENRSPIIPLVRTKRFGDRISNPEAKEFSYRSEVDNSKVSKEPYAEDNGIIDSILSKMDYRSGYEPKRSVRNDNEACLEEEEISSPTGERTPVRNKREEPWREARKKGFGERRGSNKRKKGYEGLGKKHHSPNVERAKIKRESDDSFDWGTNFEWQTQFGSGDENFYDRRWDTIDQDVISPHDGRRRRVSGEEDDENFYSDPNGAAGRYRGDVRDSGDIEKSSEGHHADSRCVKGRSKLNAKARNREKRDNGLQELKYFQNVRETGGGQNRSEKIADKRLLSVDAVKPIRDIEQIVEKLLAKVNELHGYVNEVGANVGTEKSQASGTESNVVDRTTAEEYKVGDPVTDANGSSSRSAVANVELGRSGPCWRSPAASDPHWRPPGLAKSNGRSARNLRVQPCSKKARRKRMSHRKWDRWTDWSSCSVTCGRGRQIRWRHCIRNCSTAETEMEEKACQLPACAPGRFLGIFG